MREYALNFHLLTHDQEKLKIVEIFRVVTNDYKYSTGGGWTEAKILKELESSKALIAGDSKDIFAFILFRDYQTHLEVTYLATHPQHQKQGLIVKLLNSLIEMLKPDQWIWLEVHQDNQPAITAYLKAGFKQNGVRKPYYSDGSAALLFEYKSLL